MSVGLSHEYPVVRVIDVRKNVWVRLLKLEFSGPALNNEDIQRNFLGMNIFCGSSTLNARCLMQVEMWSIDVNHSILRSL